MSEPRNLNCSPSRHKKKTNAVIQGGSTATSPLVQVLLSTYNGERYIPQLLESLTLQDYPNVHVLVRDDGSSDDTVSLLKSSYRHLDIRVFEGANIGPTASFLELIRLSSSEAAFYALYDQDDYWKSDKIARAVERLNT